MFLNELDIGEKAAVKNIITDRNTDMRRLLDIGVTDGTEIKAVFKSPFGNPTAYLIKGTVFALRNDISDKIIVERIENEN